MQIYVGNLPLEFTDTELKALFEPFGTVRAATIGKDKKTEVSQGYGFVEMPVKAEARKAIDELRGKDMQGKPLRVKAVKPGDAFHDHARTMHGESNPGKQVFSAGRQPRGAGAIRRGGQRGS
ncbi:MAG: RNA-binding protein [Ignavibacteriae bacterium]|nr:RNA-binding protein [Ignavibacteriota bacterium]